MSSSSSSSFQQIVERAYANVTPFRALTGAGVGLSAFLFLGNLGAAQFGIVPMINNVATRTQLQLPLDVAVRQWDWFFKHAAPPFAVSVVGSAIAYLAASFYVPKSAPNADALRIWLRSASAFAVLPGAYTLSVLMPVNNVLMDLAKRVSLSSASEVALAQDNLERWTSLHAVRIVAFAVSTLAGLVPLLSF